MHLCMYVHVSMYHTCLYVCMYSMYNGYHIGAFIKTNLIKEVDLMIRIDMYQTYHIMY